MKTIFAKHGLDLSLLIARALLAIVIFGHGAQKLFGWFGGYGFSGTMSYFTETVGLPYVIGVLVILGESLGMVALFLGLFTRLMSGSLFIIMLGAFFIEHFEHGFFMNWFGNGGGEGYEFDLLVFALTIVFTTNGAGAFSLDRYLFSKKQQSNLAGATV